MHASAIDIAAGQVNASGGTVVGPLVIAGDVHVQGTLTASDKQFRIDHVYFSQPTGATEDRVIWIECAASDYCAGVIDHNTFVGSGDGHDGQGPRGDPHRRRGRGHGTGDRGAVHPLDRGRRGAAQSSLSASTKASSIDSGNSDANAARAAFSPASSNVVPSSAMTASQAKRIRAVNFLEQPTRQRLRRAGAHAWRVQFRPFEIVTLQIAPGV